MAAEAAVAPNIHPAQCNQNVYQKLFFSSLAIKFCHSWTILFKLEPEKHRQPSPVLSQEDISFFYWQILHWRRVPHASEGCIEMLILSWIKENVSHLDLTTIPCPFRGCGRCCSHCWLPEMLGFGLEHLWADAGWEGRSLSTGCSLQRMLPCSPPSLFSCFLGCLVHYKLMITADPSTDQQKKIMYLIMVFYSF